MQLARARDVPFSAAISGLVFLAVYMNLGAPLHIVYILAGYLAIYLIEWFLRSGLSGTRRAVRYPDGPPMGPRRDATSGSGS